MSPSIPHETASGAAIPISSTHVNTDSRFDQIGGFPTKEGIKAHILDGYEDDDMDPGKKLFDEVSFSDNDSNSGWEDVPHTEEATYEDISDAATYVTGFTTMTGNTFHTAVVGADYYAKITSRRLKETDTYAKLLRSKLLWPVDATAEQDWSGRGQHAEFQKTERKLIGEILEVHDTLGLTCTAKVESVMCRRILLARKTIICNRWLKKDQAVQEVAHLSRLSHAHILQVIGTYVMGNELSILLYPVAHYNLDAFLESIRNKEGPELIKKLIACSGFFKCLCDAVFYIHSRMTKHMDIKPQSILVRRKLHRSPVPLFEVYVADFGIARSYSKAEDILTDGWTSFTRKYAAPEVIEQGLRGLSADIFSLGCVFLEMSTTICEVLASDADRLLNFSKPKDARVEGRKPLGGTAYWTRLQNILETSEDRDNSYHANIEALQEFYGEMTTAVEPVLNTISGRKKGSFLIFCQMINRDPGLRPTAEVLSSMFEKHTCCESGPCQLEASVADPDDDA